MDSPLRPYHAANALLALVVAWYFSTHGGAARIAALAVFVLVPVLWLWLACTRRARAPAATAWQKVYARATLAIVSVAWLVSALGIAYFTLLLVAMRPHSKTQEVYEQPAAGRVVNRTQIEYEFGEGGVRRNHYFFIHPDTGQEEEIGRQDGDVGLFEKATNTRLHGSGERLAFVVGALLATRKRVQGEPRWECWLVGRSGEQDFLRLHCPPIAAIAAATVGKQAWEFPLPHLVDGRIDAFDPYEGRLVASCRFGSESRLTLVYRRESIDSAWGLDRAETVRRNRVEARDPFPENVPAELVALRVRPRVDLFEVPARYDDPALFASSGGVDELARARVELGPERTASFSFQLGGADEPVVWTHHLRGAWSARGGGELVFFFSDRPGDLSIVRGQPPSRWVRVAHVQDEHASYMTFLRIDRP